MDYNITQCPRCWYVIDLDDPDFLYPANRDKIEWVIQCPSCGVSYQGHSKWECMDVWNDSPELLEDDIRCIRDGYENSTKRGD